MQERRSATQNFGLVLVTVGAIPLTAAVTRLLQGANVSAWVIWPAAALIFMGLLLVASGYIGSMRTAWRAKDFAGEFEVVNQKLLLTVRNQGPATNFHAHVISLSEKERRWALWIEGSDYVSQLHIPEDQAGHFLIGQAKARGRPEPKYSQVTLFQVGVMSAPFDLVVRISSDLAPRKGHKELRLRMTEDGPLTLSDE